VSKQVVTHKLEQTTVNSTSKHQMELKSPKEKNEDTPFKITYKVLAFRVVSSSPSSVRS